jgi:hypothetical protein
MSHPSRRPAPSVRAVLGTVCLLALVLGLLAGPVPSPATAAPAAAATLREDAVVESTSWLERRVGPGRLVTAPARHVKVKVRSGKKVRWVRRTRPGSPYAGVSIDVLTALRRLDPESRTPVAMVRALQRPADRYASYTIGALRGRYAEATARLVAAAASSGIPLGEYADGTLRRTLAAMVVKSRRSPQRGRVVDSGWGGDTSNTLSQAAAVRALAAVDSRHLPIVARFLAKQSCEAGHFRLSVDSPDFTCRGSKEARNRTPDLEATAAAVLALRTARAHGVRRLDDEISAASAWLSRRVRLNGRVGRAGEADARTSGLVVLALRATGRRGAAGNAAAWLLRHQVDETMIRRHPALRGQRGAIALNRKVLVRAQHRGIRRADRKLWLQSTAAAAPALTALLPARQLTVRATPRGKRLVVRVTGLVVGERFTLHRNGRAVASGRAEAPGVARVVLRAPRGKVRLEAHGNRRVRAGVTVVSRR